MNQKKQHMSYPLILTLMGIVLVLSIIGSVVLGRYPIAFKELVGIDKPDHDTICNAYKNTKTWITELDIGTGKETVLLDSNVYNLFSVEIVDDERIIYISIFV